MDDPTNTARHNIFAIVVGLGITTAFAKTLGEVDELTLLKGANGVSFLLIALLFYHAKVATIHSREHIDALDGRPNAALIDYALNFLVFGGIATMPYFLDRMTALIVVHLVVRVFDLFLVVFTKHIHDDQPSEVVKAQNTWMSFDVATILLLVGMLVALASGRTWFADEEHCALTVLGVMLADLVMDVLVNHTLFARWRKP